MYAFGLLARGILLSLDSFPLPAFKKGFSQAKRKYYAGRGEAYGKAW